MMSESRAVIGLNMLKVWDAHGSRPRMPRAARQADSGRRDPAGRGRVVPARARPRRSPLRCRAQEHRQGCPDGVALAAHAVLARPAPSPPPPSGGIMRGGRAAANRRGESRRGHERRRHERRPVRDEKYRVRIFDTTLRDGEQSPGISLNKQEKLEIAHQLARLGVDIIEAGFPIASPGDFEAVQAIAREVHGPGDLRPGAHRLPGHRRRLERGQGLRAAAHPHLHLHQRHPHQAPAPDHARGREGPGARGRRARARATATTSSSRPMDATRSELEFTAEVLQIALDEGATTINVPDTVGYAMPEEYAAMWARAVPAGARTCAEVVTSVHCHDDLGLAVANSLAGVQAGCRQVECAINGIGERAGNASLEEIVMLLRTREAGARPVDRRADHRDRPHEPPGVAADRLPGAAEQGDRGPQRLRARVRHPPGRRAEGAHHLRDHGRHHDRARDRTRSCSASTPAGTRCATRWRSSASRSTARR